jgi:hypothetical protein
LRAVFRQELEIDDRRLAGLRLGYALEDKVAENAEAGAAEGAIPQKLYWVGGDIIQFTMNCLNLRNHRQTIRHIQPLIHLLVRCPKMFLKELIIIAGGDDS